MQSPEFMFSAAERNKMVIYQALQQDLAGELDVLEIGAGAGSHAKYFCALQPQLTWWPTEHPSYFSSLSQALSMPPRLTAIRAPACLDVSVPADWPSRRFDVVYTANTLHIMPWSAVEAFFASVSSVLKPNGKWVIYGPFIHDDPLWDNQSNQAFSEKLQALNPDSGVRSLSELKQLAKRHHLRLCADQRLAANNNLLYFEPC